MCLLTQSLRKKCPYSEFLVCISCILTEYEDLLGNSQYSVQIRENTDQENSEYGQFLRSVSHYGILLGSIKTFNKIISFTNIRVGFA